MRVPILTVWSFAFLISACSMLNSSGRSSQPAPAAAVLAEEDVQGVLLRPQRQSEVAEIDPGMVISPDTSVEAHIRVFTPPEDIDPAMIIPGIEDRNGSPLDSE